MQTKYSKHLLCSRLIALKDESDEANNEDLPAVNGGPATCTTSPHCRLDYGQELDEKTLEGDMSIFLSTMFWLLEKARVEKKALDGSGSSHGAGKIPLLCAPFERRDFVGLDMESRGNRKRTLGRFKKHLGDLSLMCGLVKEAYDLYEQAADILRSCNDWLWLANAWEGSCAIAAMVHMPNNSRGIGGLRRNSSVQALNSGSLSMAVASLRRMGNTANGDREDKQKSPGRGSAEWDESFSKKILTNQEMLDQFHDAVVHYSKYRNAGLVETEASVKAVQVGVFIITCCSCYRL